MDYQINLNHQFTADNEAEAGVLARQYVSEHLQVTRLPAGMWTPGDVAERCNDFRKRKKEHFFAFFLDTQNRLCGRELVSVGTLNSSLIHPRETFRKAILKSCCSVIIVHNHPGGSLEPSEEDRQVTQRLVRAGKLLGIEILDHVIVTPDAYSSFREQGLL